MGVYTMSDFIVKPSEWPWGCLLPLWTPARITTALWLDAADSDTVTLSGSNVLNWLDKSGNSRHTGAATTAPTIVYNVINGLPVIRFSGSNNCSFNLDGKFPTTMLVDSRFVYYKPTQGGAQHQRVFSSTDASSQDYLASGIYMIPEFGDDGRTAGGPVIATPTNILTGANNFHRFRIGRNPGHDSFGPYLGDIAELVIASPKLTQSDKDKLEGYLAHKWALTGNLPSDHPYKTRAPRT